MSESGFAVVELDALTHQCVIHKSFLTEIEALDYLNKVVCNTEEYENPKLYIRYIDSEREISIYKRNWIFPKTLIYRYFIREYDS